MEIEAVLLTGGASRRMGYDKAKLIVDGEPLALRIARLISTRNVAVTVCGREPIPGFDYLVDQEEFAGPLAALGGFVAKAPYVFVASCDLPGFDPEIVSLLRTRIGGHKAAIPEADGRLQPLCGLYRAEALSVARDLAASGERRLMRWIASLDVQIVTDLDPRWLGNANTPQEWRAMAPQAEV